MKVKLDEWAYAPERAHGTDAGLDLRCPKYGWRETIAPGCSALIDTGVHVQLPKGTAGILISKSGLNVYCGITSTGLIDEGYTGSIKVKLYNHGEYEVTIEPGQKISQLVVVPVLYESVEIVDELEETERGNNGFGSTGK